MAQPKLIYIISPPGSTHWFRNKHVILFGPTEIEEKIVEDDWESSFLDLLKELL